MFLEKITIRGANAGDAKEIAKVNIDTWQTAYKGIVDDEYLNNRDLVESTKRWERSLDNPDLFANIALCNNQIVGFLSGGHSRDARFSGQAEIYAFYVLQSYQRKGIGQQLFKGILSWSRSNGYKSLFVWVIKTNPYQRFYEKIEGQITPITLDHTFGSTKLQLVSYQWDVSNEMFKEDYHV